MSNRFSGLVYGLKTKRKDERGDGYSVNQPKLVRIKEILFFYKPYPRKIAL